VGVHNVAKILETNIVVRHGLSQVGELASHNLEEFIFGYRRRDCSSVKANVLLPQLSLLFIFRLTLELHGRPFAAVALAHLSVVPIQSHDCTQHFGKISPTDETIRVQIEEVKTDLHFA
jgi:hypothetical protein